MAEGFLRARYNDKYEVYSAGTEPSQINPFAIEVMKEIGIDISNNTAKNIMQFLDVQLDLVVTVCDNAKENCPFFPGVKKYIHKGFQDPSSTQGSENEKLNAFRKIRDEIMSWVDSEFK